MAKTGAFGKTTVAGKAGHKGEGTDRRQDGTRLQAQKAKRLVELFVRNGT